MLHHNLYGPGPAIEPGGLFFSIFGVFFTVLLIWLLFVLISKHSNHSYWHDHSDHRVDPIDIAKERYAKGEITSEEFEKLKKDLSKD